MMVKKKKEITRRQFLATTGGATVMAGGLFFISSCVKNNKSAAVSELTEKQVNVWVRITSDNKVIIYSPAAEMGQGSMTSVPVILAEEMDADWNNVMILSSPVEAEKYGVGWYPGGAKSMTTAGSRTIRSFYQIMREAGAQIRKGIIQSAAKEWKAKEEDVTTEPGYAVHKNSGQKLSFGSIAQIGNFETLPDVSDLILKDPKDFRLIGKVMPRYDIPSKTNGTAIYGMDLRLPNMKYGFINRSPVHGSKPQLINEAELLGLAGVEAIVKLDHGIGVVASSTELGLKAKKKIQIKWTEAQASAHNSEKDLTNYSQKGAKEENQTGEVKSAMKSAENVHEATFTNKYVYHAQMEPLNAVVSVAPDKKSAELWIGSQAPDRAKVAAAEILSLDSENVKVNQLFLGGGFGRRSLSGYAAECAALAQHVDGPVNLVWTREDDLSYGAFRPQVKNFLKAGVDKNGSITAWEHVSVGPGGGLSKGGAGISHYDIPNLSFARKNIDHGIRTKHWRAVGHGPNKYAIETFIDQLAHTYKIDPYLYRLQMMQKNERARKVLERAAEMSNWNPKPKGNKAMGMAFADRDSYSCGVAQISLNFKTGVIRVDKYWCALDAGVVVQPDNAIAQVEGAVIMGISSSLKEQIEIQEGKVIQSNFHNYPILRMSEAPESIDVSFIDSDESPDGLGEAGLPAVGGAIASAFAALTGKYLYDMPFSPESVLKALKS